MRKLRSLKEVRSGDTLVHNSGTGDWYYVVLHASRTKDVCLELEILSGPSPNAAIGNRFMLYDIGRTGWHIL